jgi:hypothetical protein
VRLKDGSLLAVFRVDSCHPYWHSRSKDGRTWSVPSSLAVGVNGSARPKLLLLPDGRLLLAGGRPGLYLYRGLGDAAATSWTPLSVAAVHNGLTADRLAWRFQEGFANDSAAGAPCAKGGPAGSTSYTSLLQVAPGEYVLQYDRLANGWQFPLGCAAALTRLTQPFLAPFSYGQAAFLAPLSHGRAAMAVTMRVAAGRGGRAT